MKIRRPALAAAVFVLLSLTARSQSSVSTGGQTPAADRSFYLGRLVDHPEALSGVWETSNGRGGDIGIHLLLGTTVPPDGDPPQWTPQSWQYLEVGVFERTGPEPQFGEDNSFSDSTRGGSLTFAAGRLQLHFFSTWKDTGSIDLDLVRQPDDCWYGRFHRGDFDSVVTLCRPSAGPDMQPSPLVGTWSQAEGIGACVHVTQTGPDTFTGWSDAIQVPGRIGFAPGIQPHPLFQHFGDLMKVHHADDGNVTFELGAYNGICCPHLYSGKLSADGVTIRGDFPPGPNQAPHAVAWKKMPGDSCVNPAELHKFQATPCPPAIKPNQ